jgi:hypothetical protein
MVSRRTPNRPIAFSSRSEKSSGVDAEEWRDLVGAYLDAGSAAVVEMGGKVARGIYGRWLKIKLYFSQFPLYQRAAFTQKKSYMKSERFR